MCRRGHRRQRPPRNLSLSLTRIRTQPWYLAVSRKMTAFDASVIQWKAYGNLQEQCPMATQIFRVRDRI